MRLFRETVSHKEGIRIEIVNNKKGRSIQEIHPATTIGLTIQKPTIQFVDSMDKAQRVEAIAHELLHLLLVYRFGLGIIGRRDSCSGNSEDVFHYFMNMSGDWVFLLNQIVNTAHHLILTDYLREVYGIESHLHLHLLQHNLHLLSKENCRDQESLYARGLIAFEYESLVGKIDKVMNPSGQPELFWKAYNSANEHFGGYRFPNVPDPSAYEENILSFLEEFGYEREGFTFFR